MKIKTSELTGAALDWAVAYANLNGKQWEKEHYGSMRVSKTKKLYLNSEMNFPYEPSINWSQGGPIIEREKIEVTPPVPNWWGGAEDTEWMATSLPVVRGEATLETGSTPLIAAMRCYVASKVGDEVEVPDELL